MTTQAANTPYSCIALYMCILSSSTLLAESNGESGCGESGCDESANSCKSFKGLEKSLFENESNTLSLSTTFYPLEVNPPEFVKVTYHFSGTGKSQEWFWSLHTSHFLHPLGTFQFMSLLFSKTEVYYVQELDLILKAECRDAGTLPSGEPKLQLLTQRVSLHDSMLMILL